jgi:hypothetical protein
MEEIRAPDYESNTNQTKEEDWDGQGKFGK